MAKRVLLVEDEEMIVEILQEYLALVDPGIELVVASNLKEAREKLAKEDFDACICDCHLSDGDACTLFEEELIKIPTIVTTGYVDPEKLEMARKKSQVPIQVLKKPYQTRDLYDLLRMFVERKETKTADGE